MPVFRYAEDYYGGWLPQQILVPAGLLILCLVVLFLGIHLLRRSRGQPVSIAPGEPAAFRGGPVSKYEPGARLYHWGNFSLVAGLAVSGVALLAPGSLKHQLVSWLRTHEVLAAVFIAGVLFHAVAALVKGEPRSMWLDRQDSKDLRLIAASFFDRTRDYPRFGKYHPFQKLYHALLAIASAVVVFTGVFLFLSAESLTTFSHEWLRWTRLLHDLGSLLFASIVVGHIYFGVIRANWPELRALFTGTIPAEHARLRHSAARWKGGKEGRFDG